MKPDISKIIQKFYLKHNDNADIFPSSIEYEKGLYVMEFLEKIKPQVVFELGIGHGLTSLWIQAASHKIKKHVMIDVDKLDTFSLILDTLNDPSMIFIKKSTQEYLAELLHSSKAPEIDLFFHDADQRFDGFITDFYFMDKILKTRGYIILRNIWNPSVLKATLFIINNRDYTLGKSTQKYVNILKFNPYIEGIFIRIYCRIFTNNFCILQKTYKDTRPWNSYVNF